MADDCKPVMINVGSRKSQLALIQTHQVINQLKKYHPEAILYDSNRYISYNVKSMSTLGDRVLDQPLPEIGQKSLFTGELESELLKKSVDFVVHSLKDLPTTLPKGCTIGAVIKRDCPDDVVVLSKLMVNNKIPALDLINGKNKAENRDFKIGSSSKRRIAMLRRSNPKLHCIDIRGNLNTRLNKLDSEIEPYDAIILASAGLTRMGWQARESLRLNRQDSCMDHWLHAVGQGAIAIECRQGDLEVLRLLERIIDLKTTYEIIAERSLMKKLEAGCSVPLGVRSSWPTFDEQKQKLRLEAIVLSNDGMEIVKEMGEFKLYQDTLDLIPEDVECLTGIATQSSKMSKPSILSNMIGCHTLGSEVAQRMINNGCLKLL